MKPTLNQIAGCVGKLTYETAGKAHDVAAKQRNKGRNAIAYKCALCSKWHIGRSSAAGRNA